METYPSEKDRGRAEIRKKYLLHVSLYIFFIHHIVEHQCTVCTANVPIVVIANVISQFYNKPFTFGIIRYLRVCISLSHIALEIFVCVDIGPTTTISFSHNLDSFSW